MRLQSLLITLSIFAGIANAKEITHHCDKLQIINPQDSKVSLIAVPNSEFKIYDDLSAVVTIEGQVQERTAVEATPDQSVTPEMAAFILTSSGIEKTSAANIREVKTYVLRWGNGKDDSFGDDYGLAVVRFKSGKRVGLTLTKGMNGKCSLVNLPG